MMLALGKVFMGRPVSRATTAVMISGLALALQLSLSGVQAASRPAPPRADDADTLNWYLTDVWQTEEGLPQNAIQAITQTRDGYLWFGTPVGLVRFDGVRFTVFNQGQLQNNNIHALLEDRDGRLWIGTYGGGLYRYAAGRFVSFGLESGLESKFIRTLYEAGDGALWVGTNGGGVSFGKDGRFRTLRTKHGLTHDIVRVIHEDRHGCLWIGTNGGGLNCWANDTIRGYALKSGTLTPYEAADAVSNDNVLAIVRDRRDRLWIGSDGGGLWQLRRGRVDKLEHHSAEAHGVRRLLEDAAGNLWIATDGGGVHRLRDQRLERLSSREGLPNDIVLALFEDREHNIWAGTREGLVRLRKGKFLVYTTSHGLGERLRHGAAAGARRRHVGRHTPRPRSARTRPGRARRVQPATAARRRAVARRRQRRRALGRHPARTVLHQERPHESAVDCRGLTQQLRDGARRSAGRRHLDRDAFGAGLRQGRPRPIDDRRPARAGGCHCRPRRRRRRRVGRHRWRWAAAMEARTLAFRSRA